MQKNQDVSDSPRITHLSDRLTYLSDRPVGLENDLLWDGKTIREEIERIAERVVSPLYSKTGKLGSPDQTSSSITFAIYGEWGMGKSTALRMLEEAIVELAQEKLVSEQIYFCKYGAPSYEALSKSYDARTTMAFSILTALARGPKAAIDMFLDDAIAVSKLNDILPPGPVEYDDRKATQVLSRMAVSLSSLVDFDKIVEGHLRDEEGRGRMLVVMIDDLDRCDTEFIWQVLNSIQQLSDIQNLFFVLAVDENLLRETVRERFKRANGVIDPDFALEKYIQHAVSVPNLDVESLKLLVSQLSKTYGENDFVSLAIVENIQFFNHGLKKLTPRSVKRCLNTIRPDLRRKLKDKQSEEAQKLVVKERILEYVWPDFYQKYFFPAQKGDIPSVGLFTEFQSICRQFHDDKDYISFSLSHISNSYRIHLEEYFKDPKLVEYIALPPFWFEKSSAEGNVQGATDGEKDSEVKKSVSAMVEDIDHQDMIMRLYYRAEAAEADERVRDLHDIIVEFYNFVVTNRQHFNAKNASTVGNMAINAEQIKAKEWAIKLYELALELDPEHSNNMQNFVDYIVKAPLPEYYDLAEKYLAKLRDGKHAQHQPERTFALANRLHTLRSTSNQAPDSISSESIDSTESIEEGVRQFVQQFLERPSNTRSFVQLVTLLAQIQDYASIREVAKAYHDANTSPSNRYVAIRTAADAIAAAPSKDEESARNEGEAMEMYRYLLKHRDDYEITPSDLPDIFHNYAIHLYRNDFDDEAGRLWFQAYKGNRTDTNIRRAYAGYLHRAGRLDLAQKVADGEEIEIDKPVLQPATKEIPESFIGNDVDTWWESKR